MSRAPILLLALAVPLFGRPASAQNAPIPDDSARQIYDDVFLGQPAPPGFVVLSEGIVYRLEVEPAAAAISVRSARRPTLPPLLLVPMNDASAAGGGASFLMVPRSSTEYRLDVTTVGDEPVRLRIWVDPKENARWARMREETRNEPPAGVSLRWVHFEPFRSEQAPGSATPASAPGTGVEACLALLPHGSWMDNAFGGCLLTITNIYRSKTAGNVILFGTAPRVELWTGHDRTSLALELQVALGETTTASRSSSSVHYFVFGVGGLLTVPLPLMRQHLFGEVELGVTSIDGSTGSHDDIVSVVPRLAAGLQLAF